MDLELTLDISEVELAMDELRDKLQAKLNDAAQALAIQAHSFIVGEAQSKLHARREPYLEALSVEQVSGSVWSVTLKEKALWIEDGMASHTMLQDLLSSPKAKTGKDGSKYIVIPFKHGGKAGSNQTTQQKQLLQVIKTELKARGIPYKGIEKHADGSPKLGAIHRFDINKPSPKQPHHTNHLLDGLTIYQRQRQNADGSPRMTKSGQPSVSREIMTFRIASSKQAGSGKWEHPGLSGVNFFDQAYAECNRLWEVEIKPSIMQGLGL